MKKIGIIGAGAWGTALAQVYTHAGRDVMIWGRESDVVESINTQHVNSVFLPDIPLNDSIKATESLTEAADSDVLLVVTPAQHFRATMQSLKPDIADGKPVVICSKGVELDTGLLLSQVLEEEVPHANAAVLTGPTFAHELAMGKPSAVTLAIEDKELGTQILELLGSRLLRPYITQDVIGAQIGGAAKNVIAIACGAVMGRGIGESARAALMTRGVAEMARLGSAMGAKKTTLMGMCGFGDLALTASSMQSRNYSFGFALGQGESQQDILSGRKAVTEGVHTAEAIIKLAEKTAVDLPIAMTVHDILSGAITLSEGFEAILNRPFSTEIK